MPTVGGILVCIKGDNELNDGIQHSDPWLQIQSGQLSQDPTTVTAADMIDCNLSL